MTTSQMLIFGSLFISILVHGGFTFFRISSLQRTNIALQKIKREKEEADKIIQESKHTLQHLAEREAKINQWGQNLAQAKENFEQVVSRYAISFQHVNRDDYASNGMSRLFDMLSPKEHVLFDTARYLLDGDCSYRKLYQTFHEKDQETVSFLASLEDDWGIEEATHLSYSETFIRDTLKKRESTAKRAGLIPISFQETWDTFYLLQGKQGTSRRLVSGSELIHIWKAKQEEKEPNIDKETAQLLEENKAEK